MSQKPRFWKAWEMAKWCLFSYLVSACTPQPLGVAIYEGTYEDRPHFIVHTSFATYYYDLAGGGLSRLLDPEGNDWVAFQREPWDRYPASAASAYRGLPNFVFRSADSGAGHPGHDQCRSEVQGDMAIVSRSLSGKWQWRWTFYPDHAKIEMLKTDPEHPYWFLYEGTPGGQFDPDHAYFGTDTGGPWDSTWDYYAGEELYGLWQSAYFGHDSATYELHITQQEPDSLPDTFGYLGNTEAGLSSPDGMVVFGFGRAKGAQPLMTGRNVFVVRLGVSQKH